MDPVRPDLEQVPAEVRAYIEWLEAELARSTEKRKAVPATPSTTPGEMDEPPTTANIITISHGGLIKRTPRHFYGRQRRGGMGVFDLESPEEDAPAVLAHGDEKDILLLLTDQGRSFRLPLSAIPASPVRARGQALADLLPMRQQERMVAALAEGSGQYVILFTQRGWVRRVRATYLGQSLIPGTSFHDLKEGGPLVAACSSRGDEDVFLATREGKGIRFAETQIPARGCLGIRLDVTDAGVAVAAVRPDSGVFLLGQDGMGTVRLMSGFSANKSPGAGGKVVMKTSQLVGAATAGPQEEIFIISRLGKIIRFLADEIPAKEGVVQGVNCLSLRSDEAVAMVVTATGTSANG
ncbi:MAG: DNA gyrase C-terminal beta-propeller domain-containing protein [Chloroflexota bacterium]|jgi:DNA gyrase subunit A